MSRELPRYQQAKQSIREIIGRLTPKKNKLPSEPALTHDLGMSRETIRKAMIELCQEGLITKSHGKGNFGHPAVSRLHMRYDLNSNFRLILENSGFLVTSIRTSWQPAQQRVALKKRIPECLLENLIELSQRYYANGKLAVVSDVFIAKTFLIESPEAGEFTDSINEFFAHHCTEKSEYVLAWPKAIIKEERAMEFGLEPHTPLLAWEEVYYNLYDEPMGLIEAYFNPDIMDLSMLLHFT